MVRFPAWLAFVIFVPLQIWIFLEMKAAWGWGWTILAFVVIGIVAARAARAGFLRETFFPRWAARWEKRRHIYQGALLLAAAVTFLAAWGPQPWLPAAALTALAKASVR